MIQVGNVQISIALDPDGHPVHIEDARSTPNYYRCPECRDFVNPRNRGQIRAHHFSHAPGTMQEHACPLGTQTDVDRLMERYRTSEAERAESERKIQVFLGTAHESVLQLFGILPSLSWDAVEDPSRVSEILEKTSIDVEGLSKDPAPEWFHPNEPEVRLDLNPDAAEFVVRLDSGGMFESIEGDWRSPGLSLGAVFVGERTRARRIDTDRRDQPTVKPGDWVYVVVKEPPHSDDSLLEEYRLGPWSIVGFEVNQQTESLLQELAGVKRADKLAFYADVILPPWANPASEAPILGEPESKALIALLPPENSDPVFEIVSVPRHRESIEITKKAGLGEPRLIYPVFPKAGSRRLIIHWTTRQRLVHLHAEHRANTQAIWNHEPRLGVTVRTEAGEVELLDPVKGPSEISVTQTEGTPHLSKRLEFEGPEGTRLDMELVTEREGTTQVVRRFSVSFEEVLAELPYIIDQDWRRLVFRFDSLGRVEIQSGDPLPWQEYLPDDELEERVRALDNLPKKARWSLVRRILEVSPGTSHREISGGSKKRIRRIFMEVRREREESQ